MMNSKIKEITEKQSHNSYHWLFGVAVRNRVVFVRLLTLMLLMLLSSNAQKSKKLWKSSKASHVGIHWKALTEYFQMSTHLPWFQSVLSFLPSFQNKLATSSIRVKHRLIATRLCSPIKNN